MLDSSGFPAEKDAVSFLAMRFADVQGDQLSEFFVSSGLIRTVSIDDKAPPGAYPALIKRYRWVIQNDDLKLVDALFDGLRSTASAGFFLAAGVAAPAKLGALVGVLTSLFKVAINARAKGVTLDPRSFAILLALKNGGPHSIEELHTVLQTADSALTRDAVEKCLERLKTTAVADGTTRQLVATGPDGTWRAVGV